MTYFNSHDHPVGTRPSSQVTQLAPSAKDVSLIPDEFKYSFTIEVRKGRQGVPHHETMMRWTGTDLVRTPRALTRPPPLRSMRPGHGQGQAYHLYTHSYLGYGSEQAREAVNR